MWGFLVLSRIHDSVDEDDDGSGSGNGGDSVVGAGGGRV